TDLGVDLDASTVSGDDALGDGQPETGAVGLLRVEGLEELRQALAGDAGAGVADREGDVTILRGDLEGQTTTAVHGLDTVEDDVPEDLGDLVAVEREAGHGRVDRDLHVHAGGARRVVADQPADVLDDIPQVGRSTPSLLGTREVQEVGEDAIE